MNQYRQAAVEEATELRDSNMVVQRLREMYMRLDARERILADDILSEWVLSADESMRFDAMALIREFRVAKGLPALRELSVRLSLATTPANGLDELEKVKAIIDGLYRLP